MTVERTKRALRRQVTTSSGRQSEVVGCVAEDDVSHESGGRCPSAMVMSLSRLLEPGWVVLMVARC